jgi:hypothetical protein
MWSAAHLQPDEFTAIYLSAAPHWTSIAEKDWTQNDDVHKGKYAQARSSPAHAAS